MVVRLLRLYIVIIFSLFSFVASAQGLLTYHGRIIAPNSYPLEESNVTFTLQVYSPGTEQCVLYEETQTLDLTNSQGLFSVNIGQGTVTVDDPGLGLTGAIDNHQTKSGLNCSVGSSYTPLTGHGRKLRVTFDYPGSTGPVTITPDVAINSTPYSYYASRLGGLEKNQFLQVNSGGSQLLNQANLESIFTTTNYPLLMSAVDGTHPSYASASDLPVTGGTLDMSGGGQDIIVNDTPPTSNSAVNQTYSDTHLGGKQIDSSSITGLTGSAGDGYGLMWDETTQTFVAGPLFATDSSKLPLAGGTMTGAIEMSDNNITGIGDLTGINNIELDGSGQADFNSANLIELGYITIMPERSIHLGSFTNAQESTYTATLGALDAGKFWYNFDSNEVKYWNGTSAVTSGVQIGTSAGLAMGADAVPNCLSSQKLQMSPGPTFTWSCVTDNEGEVNTASNQGASGVGLFDTKSGVDLQFKNIDAGSTRVVITNDAVNKTVDIDINPAVIDHDSLFNFSANEHIDHSAVSITAGDGLSGGGDLTATRNLAVNVDNITIETASDALRIKDDGVTSAKIAPDTIVAADIAAGAVGSSEILDESIVSADIDDGGIATSDLADGSVTDVKIGTVSVDKIISGATRYFTYQPANTACANNDVLKWDNTNTRWVCGSDDTGVSDHGSLSGLTDDDHTQYALLAGRAGGQNLTGGTAANDNLTLESTSNATKGDIVLNPNGGFVGVGTATPASVLEAKTSLESGDVVNVTADSFTGVSLGVDSSSVNHQIGRINLTGSTNVSGDRGIGGRITANSLNDIYQNNDAIMQFNATSSGGSVTNANLYSFNENDIAQMVIDSNGNMGVGVNAPSSKLDVNGDINVRELASAPAVSSSDQGRIYFDAAANKFKVSENGGAYVDLIATSGIGSGDFLADGSVAMTGNLQLNDNWLSNDGGNEGIRIDNAGNVGVGTLAPSARLDIVTSSVTDPAFNVEPGDSGYYTAQINNNVYLSTYPAGGSNLELHAYTGLGSSRSMLEYANTADGTNPDLIIVKDGGNVGIGETSPSAKLDIVSSVSGVSGVNISGQGAADTAHDLYIARSSSASTRANGPNIRLDDGTVSNSMLIQNSEGALTFWNFGNGGSWAEHMRIAKDGSVGVGTVNPSSVLDVDGDFNLREMVAPGLSSSDQGRIYFDSTANKFKVSEHGGAYVDLIPTSGSGAGDFLADGSVAMTGNLQLNDNWLSNDGGSEGIRIDNAGNVGVGTSAPSTKLEIYESTATSVYLKAQNSVGDVDFGTNSAGLGTVWNRNNLGLQFGTNDTSRMVIDEDGNVGIGASTPSELLHVNSIGATTMLLSSSGAGATHGATMVMTNDTPASAAVSMRSSGYSVPLRANKLDVFASSASDGIAIGSSTTDPILFYQNGATERMRVHNNGNVGIGTPTPEALLHVNNGNNSIGSILASTSQFHLVTESFDDTVNSSVFRLGFNFSTPDAANGYIDFIRGSGGGNGYLGFGTSNTERMRIDTTGNIGIGTVIPSSKLDVNGDINMMEMTAPSVSSSDQGRIYFDSTANKFKVSEHGGAYVDLIPTSGSGAGDFLADGSVDMTGNLQLNGNWLSNDGGNEGIRVDNSGNVGVGTSAPDAYLHVQNGDLRPSILLEGATKDIAVPHDQILQFGHWNKSSDTFTERMRIDTLGNVGIGAASPGDALHVNAGNRGMILRDDDSNTATLASVYLEFQDSTGTRMGYIGDGSAGSDNMTLNSDTGEVLINTASSNSIHLRTASTTRFSVNGAGNVGIGNPSPSDKLHVYSNSAWVTTTIEGVGAGNGASLNIYGDEDQSSLIRLKTKNDETNHWDILARGDQHTSTTEQNDLLIQKRYGGVFTTPFMIDGPTGNVGIGTSNPGEELEVNGDVKAVSFIMTSDRRLKRDIATVPGLEAILDLGGYSYDWVKDGTTAYGVIAQEVEEVLPHAVHTDENSGFKGVNYSALIAPIIEAIKELYHMFSDANEEIQTLQNQVDKLQSENDDLKKRLEKIEEKIR